MLEQQAIKIILAKSNTPNCWTNIWWLIETPPGFMFHSFFLVFLNCFFLFYFLLHSQGPSWLIFHFFSIFLHLFLRFYFRFSRQLFQFYLFACAGCVHVLLEGNENCAAQLWPLWQPWQLATGNWQLHLLSWQSAIASRVVAHKYGRSPVFMAIKCVV